MRSSITTSKRKLIGKRIPKPSESNFLLDLGKMDERGVRFEILVAVQGIYRGCEEISRNLDERQFFQFFQFSPSRPHTNTATCHSPLPMQSANVSSSAAGKRCPSIHHNISFHL